MQSETVSRSVFLDSSAVVREMCPLVVISLRLYLSSDISNVVDTVCLKSDTLSTSLLVRLRMFGARAMDRRMAV